MPKISNQSILFIIISVIMIFILNGCSFHDGKAKQQKDKVETESTKEKKEGDIHKLKSKFDDIFGFGDLKSY